MHMRVRSVRMGRVWVCILLYFSQIHYSHMVAQKQAQGLGCAKKQGPRESERALPVCELLELGSICFVVYYQSIKRKLNRRIILECRCDERLFIMNR